MPNKTFFTVGPTELFPEVKKIYQEALKKKIFSISHRSLEFSSIFNLTVNNLKKLLNIPQDFNVFFLSSATECMERIIQNLVLNKSFHYDNGFFAERFFNISVQYNKSAEKFSSHYGTGTDFKNIKLPENTELLCIVLNETSTGVALNINDIKRFKQKNPDVILALDIVTAVPYYKIDFRYIDCAFFSVQKGFGMPPGLGVLILNEKCIKKAEEINKSGISIGSYNNFLKLKENFLKNQTTITPNIPLIYILGKISDFLLNYGIDKIRNETEKKAELLYNYFDEHNFIKPFVKEEKFRSKTTITLQTEIESDKIIKTLSRNGFVISYGYNIFKNKHIRIGNFPMHRIEDVRKLIKLFHSIKLD